MIGIVPGEAPSDANDHVTHVVASGIGYGRNLSVVASADAVIAVGGEWGTLSEIAFACRLPRPVIALQSWTVTAAKPIGGPGIEEATDAAEAVEAALRRVRPGNG